MQPSAPPSNDWEQRVAALWDSIGDYEPDEFVRQMTALAEELPKESPEGLFERGSAFDSTGHSDQAFPLYQQALKLGLQGQRRRRATIQLASSLRNMGKPEESVALLQAEQNAASDDLDDAVNAFLALALADTGREREGLSLVLKALAPHLTRYQRSCANYADLLLANEHEN